MNPRLHGEEEIPSRPSGGTTTVNKAGDATAQTPPPPPSSRPRVPPDPDMLCRARLPFRLGIHLDYSRGPPPHVVGPGGGGSSDHGDKKLSPLETPPIPFLAAFSRFPWRPAGDWWVSRDKRPGRPAKWWGASHPNQDRGAHRGGQPLLMSHRRIFDNRTNPAVHEGR